MMLAMMSGVVVGGVWEPIMKWRTHMLTIFTGQVRSGFTPVTSGPSMGTRAQLGWLGPLGPTWLHDTVLRYHTQARARFFVTSHSPKTLEHKTTRHRRGSKHMLPYIFIIIP